jgi:hypothetical protein
MFKPWKGSEFDKTGLLILGESAYSWWEGDELHHPTTEHVTESVCWAISNFKESSRFFRMVSRALANEQDPTESRLNSVWNRVAFTNYVTTSVGEGARTRPSPIMWAEAKNNFLGDISKISPKRIIVLGRTLWTKMPDTDVFVTDDVQGYSLSGDIVMCQAVDHPAGGLSWQKLASVIYFTYEQEFRA